MLLFSEIYSKLQTYSLRGRPFNIQGVVGFLHLNYLFFYAPRPIKLFFSASRQINFFFFALRAITSFIFIFRICKHGPDWNKFFVFTCHQNILFFPLKIQIILVFFLLENYKEHVNMFPKDINQFPKCCYISLLKHCCKGVFFQIFPNYITDTYIH